MLRQWATSVTARTKLAITVDGEPPPLGQDVEHEAYYLVRESVHNAVKHAAAEHVHVHLGGSAATGTTLRVHVRDDGVGFDPSTASAGLGLTSMRDRVERLGGTFSIDSAPGAGCTITAEVPGHAAGTPR